MLKISKKRVSSLEKTVLNKLKGFSKRISKEKEFLEMGNDYLFDKNYETAISLYSRALKIAPDNIDALIKRGKAYLETYEYEKAYNDFSSVLNNDPLNKDSLEGRSQAREKLEG